jgi:hypothetical protein
MIGEQSRKLKPGDRICWGGASKATDFGTVIAAS